MEDLVSQLVQAGLLDADGARDVRKAVVSGKSIDDALRAAAGANNGAAGGGASEEKVLRFLAEHFALPFVDLEKDGERLAPPKELLAKFPARILLDRRIMPLAENGDGVSVVTSRVFDTTGLDELRLATGLDVHPVLAPSTEIDRFIKKYLGVGADTLQSMGLNANDEADAIRVLEEQNEDDLDLSSAAQDASIIKFVNQVMAEALDLRPTDVHIEPYENQLRVRYRIDGVLVEANIPPQVRKYHAAIVSRIKILSHLDIAEKRLPQDGNASA